MLKLDFAAFAVKYLIIFTHLYSSSMSDMAEIKTSKPAVNESDTEQFLVPSEKKLIILVWMRSC